VNSYFQKQLRLLTSITSYKFLRYFYWIYLQIYAHLFDIHTFCLWLYWVYLVSSQLRMILQLHILCCMLVFQLNTEFINQWASCIKKISDAFDNLRYTRRALWEIKLLRHMKDGNLFSSLDLKYFEFTTSKKYIFVTMLPCYFKYEITSTISFWTVRSVI